MPVWTDARGRVTLGGVPSNACPAEGVAGWGFIVQEGALAGRTDTNLAPRTAIGVDRAGTTLWLVVVDGRQPGYSEGMSWRELGAFMRGLGCWNAMNMDGGGSSAMGLAGADGRLRIVNRPSDRREGLPRVRPVPTVLILRPRGGS